MLLSALSSIAYRTSVVEALDDHIALPLHVQVTCIPQVAAALQNARALELQMCRLWFQRHM